MKPWRPDNWAEIKRKLCNERLKDVGGADCETCSADPQPCGIPQEETVDAFLEALKQKGTVYKGIDGEGMLFKIPSGTGRLVFIPDDK